MREVRADGSSISSALAAASQRALLSALCEAQRNQCGICRKPLAPLRTIKDLTNQNRPTMEHVVPKSMRGRDGRGNILASHSRCNHEKNNRMPTPAELAFLEEINRIMRWPNFHCQEAA